VFCPPMYFGGGGFFGNAQLDSTDYILCSFQSFRLHDVKQCKACKLDRTLLI